jgi:isopentenyl-diphosphate delta-isomerase
MPSQVEGRKADHLRICLEENVQARKITTGFEDVFFVHNALPEIDREKIDLSTAILGHKLSAPILVSAMTGGAPKAREINGAIAAAVEELDLGMGVGSQRAAIEDPKLEGTFSIVRKRAPTAFIIANIGGPQLVKGYSVEEARKAIEMLDANALAIHLNPLQEAVQPEGETNYLQVVEKIGELADALEVPIIVKETGAGIAAEEARVLQATGVASIDVAGAGGTSWAAVEYHRAKGAEAELHQRLGKIFWDWGIPTAVSLVEVVQSTNLMVVASGGIRSGKDTAKALALGATASAMAAPVLRPAETSPDKVKALLKFVIEELRTTMFLVGAESVERLAGVSVVLTGKTAEWLRTRGFQPELYARRKK